ncbi:hypothetical protein DTW90_34570 [Neorhizobium sp. P12A]|uniref:hypothetical protein n=1 Tax=Neorhizobium sp. P12A TaxID=2268027 RepID=UPI0011EEAFCF|nr:hypothetical protein [Neorhizobium sp. P12A]KAA0686013.1 hypothetical protein DTW90_34570 [Neorhizobium sp. P12A]
MKKLKAPSGSEGANIGTRLFVPDSEGNVMVPDDAVPGLVGVGGFQIMPIPDGYVVMRSLIGAQSVTTHGETYETDGDNMIAVPRDLADDLLSHNFEYIGIKETEAEPVAEQQTDEEHVKDGVKDDEVPMVPLGTKPPEAAEQVEASEEVKTEEQPAETAETAKSAE